MSILKETKFIMNKYHITANKNLGQNFLINSEVVENIVNRWNGCRNSRNRKRFKRRPNNRNWTRTWNTYERIIRKSRESYLYRIRQKNDRNIRR